MSAQGGGTGQAPGHVAPLGCECWLLKWGPLGLGVGRGIGIIQSVLSDHSEVKLEINYKKRMRKSPSVWKLGNPLPNTP